MPLYSELFRPGRIGGMDIRNRLVMPPMVTGFGSSGYSTDRLKAHYEERARGGVGLVIVEASHIEARGWGARNWLRIDDGRFIPGLRQLVQVIRRHGAKAILQISHVGRNANSSLTGCQPVAPSPIFSPDGEVPRELSAAEIGELVHCFAQAASRAKQAGFDGIELHAAHTALINQFLMPSSNRRKDEYGGDLKNRARFLLQIVEAVKEAVGRDYPCWCRIGSDEAGLLGSRPLEEALELARALQVGGADAIHVSGSPAVRSYFSPHGYFVTAAAAIKRLVSIPVIVCGGMTPELGEQALERGEADFVAMGRALIADPQLPNKLAAGNMEDIVPCIRCLECFDTLLVKNEPIRCTVNPSVGREREDRLSPAKAKKRVLIVGGGPAGLEAARTSALRGHHTVLYERNEALGGQMLLAAKAPHKELIASLTKYLAGQVNRLQIQIELGRAVDAALIEESKPDALIVATGADPLFPQICGINKENVVTAEDVLSGKAEVQKKVAVVGGGLVGCETALMLTAQGKTVRILEVLPEILATVTSGLRQAILEEMLRAEGLSFLTGVACEGVTDAGLVIRTSQGSQETIEAQTIVLAAGSTPNRRLVEALRDKVTEAHLIGDCREPGNILAAIRDGFRVGQSL